MHKTLVCIAHFPCSIGKKEKQKYTSTTTSHSCTFIPAGLFEEGRS